MIGRSTLAATGLAVAGIFASGLAPSAHGAGTDPQSTKAAGTGKTAEGVKIPPPSPNWHAREGLYFQKNWGVDIVGVRRLSSGSMLEFRYRVIDADKAKPLLDKHAKAYLIDAVTGATLSVPALENVGELRQTAEPEEERTYYTIFGNPGGLVKKGGQVSVVIGKFRVDGLVVD